MFNLFKNSIKILNNNIILATPLLLFLLLVSVYLSAGSYTINAFPFKIWLLVTIVMLVILLSMFYAGWFYMIKTAVNNFRNGINYEKGSFVLLKSFPIGMGDYFFTFLGAKILFVILLGLILFVVRIIGDNLIGFIGISLNEFMSALESMTAMKALIDVMTPMQLVKLNSWYLLISIAMSVFFLLVMLWPAKILSGEKNPFKVFVSSFKILIKNPKTFLLFVYISALNFVLSLLNGLALANPFTCFLMTIIYCYFFVYLFVLIFLYYEEEIKGDSDSRGNSIG